MTTSKAKGAAIGLALVVLASAEAWAQQVRAVHGAYVVLSAPPLQGVVGDTLHIYRATEKGPLLVATVELDELRADQAICKVLWEAPAYKVEVGDWAVAKDGRPPRSGREVGQTPGAAVVAVRGTLALIDGLPGPIEPGTVMLVQRPSDSTKPIGKVRLFSRHGPRALVSVVEEDSTDKIAPGDRVRPMLGPDVARAESPIPRVAKVKGAYLFVEGLPEEWAVPCVVQVLRPSLEGGRRVAVARLIVRKGERAVATIKSRKRGAEVQAGDVLALPEEVPIGPNEDLDTYFFGAYQPRR
ncbi:MAG: hypothetical protein ONB25_13355 [candidate division KSB1 bacterium]|nr:hypothetical protein [candidate division KSB1 bacterium]